MSRIRSIKKAPLAGLSPTSNHPDQVGEATLQRSALSSCSSQRVLSANVLISIASAHRGQRSSSPAQPLRLIAELFKAKLQESAVYLANDARITPTSAIGNSPIGAALLVPIVGGVETFKMPHYVIAEV
ncbi:hypothetical protein J6590_000635 [Homalodisca vitripennis]|nr:hypothetical protein J6590_000635 [Homalodisca vitripennis]